MNFIVLLVVFLTACPLSAAKPNILFFFPDQHRFDFTSMNKSHPSFANMTPTLKTLAENGVFFNMTFCPAPVCAPSRACLALGKEYNNQPVPENEVNLPLDSTTFYKLLRDSAGYNVLGFGKIDLAKAADSWGFTGTHPQKAPLLPKVNCWGFSTCYETASKGPGRDACNDNVPELYYTWLKSIGYTSCAIPTSPDSLYEDNFIGRGALKLLSEAPHDKPWFLQVGFVSPHDPYNPTSSMLAPWSTVTFPPAINNTTANPDRQKYAAMVANIDKWVKIFLDMVKARGDSANTIVVYASDHGDNLGDHYFEQKRRPQNGSTCVPFFWSGPGIRKNVFVDTTTELLDITATILDYAGVKKPAGMDSRSLRRFLETGEGYPRQYATCALSPTPGFKLLEKTSTGWRLVYDGRYKLIVGDLRGMVPAEDEKKSQVLYDIRNDAGETKDIAGANSAVVARLKQHLPEVWPKQSTSVGVGSAITSPASLRILAYPNPFVRNLRITLPEDMHQAREITITNLRGEVIRRWNLPASRGTEDLVWDGFESGSAVAAPGCYIVYARSGTIETAMRVIKSAGVQTR